MRNGMGIGSLVASASALAMTGTAAAQVPPTEAQELPSASQTLPGGTQSLSSDTENVGSQNYDAAYFAAYAPSTALQMVERVPGFSIETVNEDVRGFGSAGGNVVINGQRPSSKSETIETILSRIPANRVTRIEVGPGDRYGSEYSGKAKVLNLVLNTSSGLAGNVEASVLRDYTGKIAPEGSISAMLRTGKSTFNAALDFNNRSTTEEGYDRLTALPSGNELEYRRKVNHINDPNGTLSASWSYNDGTWRTANLNGSIALDRFKLDQDNNVYPAGGTARDDRLHQRYYRDTYEIGGDVTRPLAGGGIKLIGLATRRYRDNNDTSLNRVQGNVTGGVSQMLHDTLAETLARVVWSRPDLGGWNVEVGAEGVLNKLDSQVDLFLIGPGGGKTRVDLPVDNAVVKELRGEAFVNAGRALTSNLRMDMGATFETSQITVSGDATARRTLKFLKPKVALDWKPSAKWHVQLSVQRTVAQLQFEDFISSAELSNDRINGGNANLLPQRAWEALATIERQFLRDGLIKLELGYNRVEMVQDRVPTPEGFDAPGNLGSGRVIIVRNRIDAPLSTLGIKGGRLTLYNSLVASRVDDPYTGLGRPFSGDTVFLSEATFRQDLGKFAWGFELNADTGNTFYRRNETDKSHSLPPYLSAFAEWRPDPRTTVTFTLDNLTSTPGTRTRTFYDPDRRVRTPSALEYRERNRHIVPSLTIKRSIG